MSLNVAVIGLGWPGKKHTESLNGLDGVRVCAVADLDEARVRAFAAEHGARAYRHWRELLDGETELDAVVLATPPIVRDEPIAAIAERGLPLFCEKPPAHDVATARAVTEVIERAGILNTVGFMYRWAPLASRFRELIADRPRLFARICVAWPVFGWVTQGLAPVGLFQKAKAGGPLVEQGVHFQDILRYITGDEPTRVMAMAELDDNYPTAERDAEETSAVVVRHASGMLTSHVHNWSHAAKVLQLQIVGVDFDLTWSIHDGPLVGQVDGTPIDESDATDPYLEEIRGFVAAVRAQDQGLLRSPYRDAAQTLAVCDAAARAVLSGTAEAV